MSDTLWTIVGIAAYSCGIPLLAISLLLPSWHWNLVAYIYVGLFQLVAYVLRGTAE